MAERRILCIGIPAHALTPVVSGCHVRRRGVPDDGDSDGPDCVRQVPPAQYQADGLRGVSGPFADDALL